MASFSARCRALRCIQGLFHYGRHVLEPVIQSGAVDVEGLADVAHMIGSVQEDLDGLTAHRIGIVDECVSGW